MSPLGWRGRPRWHTVTAEVLGSFPVPPFAVSSLPFAVVARAIRWRVVRLPRVVVVRAALRVRVGVGLLAASLLRVPLVVVLALVRVRVASVIIALTTATSGCRALVPLGASIVGVVFG